MSTTSFVEFKKNTTNWETDYQVYQRDSAQFKRIKCPWREKIGALFLHHEYHAVINTETGDIYMDCRRRLIMAKHITLTFVRPLHTFAKTLWHLSIIGPLALEILDFKNDKISAKKLCDNTFNSFCDILRTPIYGLAITITHVTGVILGCISPNTLYKTRELAGKLEKDLLRQEPWRSSWGLSPCFSPICNLETEIKRATGSEVKNYQQIIPKRLAEKNVGYNRTLFLPFNCFIRLPEDAVYVSPAKSADQKV